MTQTFSWTTQCILGLLCLAACVHMLQLQGRAKHVQQHVRSGKPIAQLFHMFKQKHSKRYGTEVEERIRSEIFHSNVNHITQHNEKYEDGQSTYYLGINQFSDMSHGEFLDKYKTSLRMHGPQTGTPFVSDVNAGTPKSVDWREKGYVTHVKDQSGCGACWAFSSTGSIEGQHFRKTGKLISLSEQQLVDCCGGIMGYMNAGCNGGYMDIAFQYAKEQGGMEREKDYPYNATCGPVCYTRATRQKVKVTGFVDIESGNEYRLHEAVGNIGPVSVAIDAMAPDFRLYEGGVFNQPRCNNTYDDLNHAVLVAGYGTLDGNEFWLIKNSWSTWWGDDGYIKIARNHNNYCGVATAPSFPLV